jgi:hypothetical protein
MDIIFYCFLVLLVQFKLVYIYDVCWSDDDKK